MHILVLSKRQYTGKDLLDDRYGRLYEIPVGLAVRGHKVVGITLSYLSRDQGWHCWDDLPGMEWLAVNAFPVGFWVYPRMLAEVVAMLRPDVVWASSDVLHAVVGWYLKRSFGIPLVIDLYDNYESFGVTKLPGVTSLFRAACRAADGLTVVSHMLDKYIAATCAAQVPRLVLGNAVPKELFFPQARRESRRSLGLPLDKRLIGTAGAITRSRGIAVLFEAFLQLAAHDPDLWLVFAGPRDETPGRYRHERIIDLGTLEYNRISVLFNALDVAVICNLDSDFGRYCFPQKFYEIVSCGVPVVASDVGEMKRLLAYWPQCLFPPASVGGLVECIANQLKNPVTCQGIAIPTWEDQAVALESFLAKFCPRVCFMG